MVDAFTETIIHKPIDLVADYAANPDNAREWCKRVGEDAGWEVILEIN